MNLGYVGLGKMGGALARRLMQQHTLRVYGRRSSRSLPPPALCRPRICARWAISAT
jgi:3-hydroxyisobutyrate dehydrogenase-like beta-hydroxyacid dehydrogenase